MLPFFLPILRLRIVFTIGLYDDSYIILSLFLSCFTIGKATHFAGGQLVCNSMMMEAAT